MPFFSIVIPLYNKTDFILATLDSVVNQTFKDYEIIVVNDGSTDDGLTKVKAIKNPKLSIHNQENKGLSAARNLGITLASGHYVALLDADDIWESNYLESMFSLIKKFPQYNIFGSTYKESRKGRLMDIHTSFRPLKNESFHILDDYFAANYKQFIIDKSSLILKIDFAKTCSYSETIDVGEDVDYYLNYFVDEKIVFLNRPLVIKNCDGINKLSASVISDKKIPHLEYFKTLYKSNTSVQKYIDIQLYKLAIKYTYENNGFERQKCIAQINPIHLSTRQRFLLKSPKWVMISLRALKFYLLKLNIRLTT